MTLLVFPFAVAHLLLVTVSSFTLSLRLSPFIFSFSLSISLSLSPFLSLSFSLSPSLSQGSGVIVDGREIKVEVATGIRGSGSRGGTIDSLVCCAMCGVDICVL